MASRISILLVALFAVPVVAEKGAQDGRRRGPRGPRDLEAYVQKVADAVDASEEQIAQLEAIAAEQKAAALDRPRMTDERKEELQTLREQMRAARKAGDDEQADKLREQMRELRGPNAMRETQEKIRAILTPEQIEKFDKLVQQERGRRRGGQRGQGRRADGPPPGPDQMNIERFVKRLVVVVDATDEQKEQLNAIAAEHREAMKAAREEQEASREEHRDELRDLHRQIRTARDAGDEDAVKALHKQAQELMGGSSRELLEETQTRIAASLTEEQLPKYKALLDEARDEARMHRAGKNFRGKHKGPGKRGRHGNRGHRHGHDDDPSDT